MAELYKVAARSSTTIYHLTYTAFAATTTAYEVLCGLKLSYPNWDVGTRRVCVRCGPKIPTPAPEVPEAVTLSFNHFLAHHTDLTGKALRGPLVLSPDLVYLLTQNGSLEAVRGDAGEWYCHFYLGVPFGGLAN